MAFDVVQVVDYDRYWNAFDVLMQPLGQEERRVRSLARGFISRRKRTAQMWRNGRQRISKTANERRQGCVLGAHVKANVRDLVQLEKLLDQGTLAEAGGSGNQRDAIMRSSSNSVDETLANEALYARANVALRLSVCRWGSRFWALQRTTILRSYEL